ncbi:MAG: conjugal transfer protein TraX [Lachnospiraceae bacterium]|nr:conjugal transfer protein TraX [Lachnospiraceae bacterium]
MDSKQSKRAIFDAYPVTGFRFNGTTLKIIAVVSMFLDHFGASIVYAYMCKNGIKISARDLEGLSLLISISYTVLRYAGRVAFPIYIFLLTEGFEHTKSRLKYFLRLLLLAVLSEVPFDLALHRHVWSLNKQNVFFTLSIGFLTIWGCSFVIRKVKDNAFLENTSLVFCGMLGYVAGVLLKVDYTYTGAVAIAVMYLWRKEKRVASTILAFITVGVTMALNSGVKPETFRETYVSGMVFCLLFLVAALIFPGLRGPAELASNGILCISSPGEYFGVFAFLPILKYDGTRGKCSQLMKWLFYFFYPIHLGLFAAIMYFCKLF